MIAPGAAVEAAIASVTALLAALLTLATLLTLAALLALLTLLPTLSLLTLLALLTLLSLLTLLALSLSRLLTGLLSLIALAALLIARLSSLREAAHLFADTLETRQRALGTGVLLTAPSERFLRLLELIAQLIEACGQGGFAESLLRAIALTDPLRAVFHF